MVEQKNRVLSGIRATGRLHLGNYLGAVKGMLELQNNPDFKTFYMVADLHAMTTPYSPEELKKNRREVIIDYLAAGLDPRKSVLFLQADVPEHAELSYYFATVTTIAKLQHLPTYKDKVKQYPEHNTLALLYYPVLMAADILLYQANLVPVGLDQEPHLEVAREIARRMNQQYNLSFPEPHRFATSGEYVPSLSGEGKMSKSIEGSYITMTDSLDEIRKKVRSVPTASEVGGEPTGGVKTLFTFLELFAPAEVEEFRSQFASGSLKYVTLKDRIAEAIFSELRPIQERREALSQDQSFIDAVIREGAEKARAEAHQTMAGVRSALGF